MHEGTARGRGGGQGEVTAYLLTLAGPELYAHNAFRVAGLPADADGRTVRERRQRLTTLAATGDEKAARALAAVEDLRDERHRIAHELFSAWDNDPAGSCGCPRSLHVAHDLAVRAHAEALRLERGGRSGESGGQWADASAGWRDLVRRTAFWDHVRHRIERLGDRRMDEATVAEIREVLPRVLATPIVQLALAAKNPGTLVHRAAGWNFGARAATDLLADAAAPLIAEIETVLKEAGAELDADRPGHAARTLLGRAVPKVWRLNALLPHEGHRDTARVRDDVAVLLNNCALAAVGRHHSPGVPVRKVFEIALSLVTSPAQRATIEENAAEEERVKAIDTDLAQFGLSVAGGGFATLGDRLTQCLRGGRYTEARQILAVMGKHAANQEERRMINQLLAQLDRAGPDDGLTFGGLGSPPSYRRTPPARRASPDSAPVLRTLAAYGWAVPVALWSAGVLWAVIAAGCWIVAVIGYFAVRSR